MLDNEILIVQKATVLDIIYLLEDDERKSFTVPELQQMLLEYIEREEQA